MEDVVIVSGARTPVGAFNGAFANVPAHELGRVAIKAALERAGVKTRRRFRSHPRPGADRGAGPEPGAPGLDQRRRAERGSPAWSVNMVCGSGLRAVALGAQAIRNGDSAIVVAGGQESMSQSTHAAYLRAGQKMGNLDFIDTMIKDGLWDAFNGYHMGVTAENVAREWQITREQQDVFAVASQNKAEAAQEGRHASRTRSSPVTIKGRKGDTVVDTDEYIRDGATLEAMAKLRPAFQKDGTVTAGNASGINDGAAALVLMTASEADKRGLKPLARIVSWAQAGVDPKVMGLGSDPGLARGAGEGGLEASTISTSSRPTRPSRRRPARSTRTSAGIRPR